MPNHIHGIIAIVGVQFIAPELKGVINHAPTIGKIVRVFKAISAYEIHKNEILEFGWQRNYYERIIRNENELNQIRQYILDNPAEWDEDPENVLIHVWP